MVAHAMASAELRPSAVRVPGPTLREEPPAEVAETLVADGIDPADLVLATSSEIDRQGRYLTSWLLVTKERALVFTERDGRQVPILSLVLADALEFRTLTGVGSGFVQARVGAIWLDLIRYSNRSAYRFERAAVRLEELRRGETVELSEDDWADPRRCPRCGLMLESAGEPCPRCVRRGAVVMRMLAYLRPYRGAAVAMMAFLLVGVALDLVSPQLTRLLVDEILPSSREDVRTVVGDPALHDRRLAALFGVVATLAGVQVVRSVVSVLNGRLASRVGTGITFDMRSRLVAHLQQLALGYYDRQQVGTLVGRVAYDTESVHGLLWQVTGGFVLQALLVVGVWIMMFTIDAKLALLALVPSPLIMGGTVFFWRRVFPRYFRFWDAAGKQAGQLTGLLGGIRVVKAFHQEEREFGRFETISSALRHSRNDVDMRIATFNGIVGILFQVGGWLVWFGGGREVLAGRMTLGELMAFFGYLWMFYGPLAALPQFANWLTQFATQTSRILEVLDTPPAIADPERPVRLASPRGEVRFEDVTFGYKRHSPVLRGVSFEVRPGEMVGIVGASGSGKTTIVNLICRFYDVTGGRVLLDGVDVRDLEKRALRASIGVVLQEPFLFRGNIEENLMYGRPDASPEQVLETARAANCHDFVLRQTHAYDTWLGESGAGLSGGERQRIAIARALLTDPRVLILDEATSSIDAESEARIQAALGELVRGRTTIAIAHRLSTLRNADRIIVLERGRIREHGTHDELLAKEDGAYARLLRLQGIDPTARAADDVARAAATDTAAGLPPLEGHRVRWLTSEVATIERGMHETLSVTIPGERQYVGVTAVRCFPIQRSGYVSLRTVEEGGREVEIGIVRHIEDWPEPGRRLLLESLARRYFVHTVREIQSIDLYRNHLNFRVDTDLGPMEFTVRWTADRVQAHSRNGKLLLDTDENRYLIPDVTRLTERERRLFERYVYW